MYAKQTHKYEEAVNKRREFIKTGENSVFWGMIKWPAGYYHEQITYLGVCKHCGQPEGDYIFRTDGLDTNIHLLP